MDPTPRREPLTRERVVDGAVGLADRDGIDALTMRNLASELAVKPMSLYHHVAGKVDVLDGMVDAVFTEIEPPPTGGSWHEAIARRASSARAALRRHPWAVGLLESRTTPGRATLRHHDAVLGCLRGAGFSVPLAAHAYALLDSYVYGFVLQEVTLPFDTTEETHEVATSMLEPLEEGTLPHLVEMATQHALRPEYRFSDEFGFGLALILEGLERRLAEESVQHREGSPG